VELYPAIDVRGGRTVRLVQGDFGREVDYAADPVAVAIAFAEAGAPWVHVVDLDAARTGEPANREMVAGIARAVARANRHTRVQAGGGVRSEAAAEALFDAGVHRVVIGTAALEQPALVRRLAARHPVAVGIDARAGDVAVHGWTTASGESVPAVLARFEDAGVAAVVVTEIARDGTMTGPDLDGLAACLAATSLDVVASGGVGSLDDLRALAGLHVDGRTLAGAVVGRALHEGVFGVDEALAVARYRR
jgi:phosphoribosylformimino-5-aminoimidazole carboxamide ribotide isomerase